MVGYVRRVHLRDVARHVGCGIRKVGQIGLLRVGVPFTGEHALTALRLERQTQATDAGEQIDESEGRIRRGVRVNQWQHALANGIGQIRRRVGFAHLPPAQCTDVGVEQLRQLRLAVALAGRGE